MQVQPQKLLVDLVFEMFKQAWHIQNDNEAVKKRDLEKRLIETDKKIKGFLDRILDSDSQSVIKAYEQRIDSLENEKRIIEEKMENTTQNRKSFREVFKHTLTFLSNPYNIWTYGGLAHKRTVLKLAFKDRLTYCKNTGFQTPHFACIFKALHPENNIKSQMADTQELKPFYQGAEIQIFLYEEDTKTLKTEAYFTGHIIRSITEGGSVILFAECLKQGLYRTIGRRFSHECGFGWGDVRCGIDISLYAKTILVTDKAFDGKISFNVVGGVQWQTAPKPFLKDSHNVEHSVVFLDMIQGFLYLEDNRSVGIGNEVTLYAGCDKILSTCQTHYDNTAYYGGFLFG